MKEIKVKHAEKLYDQEESIEKVRTCWT